MTNRSCDNVLYRRDKVRESEHGNGEERLKRVYQIKGGTGILQKLEVLIGMETASYSTNA